MWRTIAWYYYLLWHIIYFLCFWTTLNRVVGLEVRVDIDIFAHYPLHFIIFLRFQFLIRNTMLPCLFIYILFASLVFLADLPHFHEVDRFLFRSKIVSKLSLPWFPTFRIKVIHKNFDGFPSINNFGFLFLGKRWFSIRI